MKKFKTKIGWYAYFTTLHDVLSWGGVGICDMCGEFHSEGGYLVPVLNHWLCRSCFNDWLSRGKYYPEDVFYERKIMSYYERILKIDEE